MPKLILFVITGILAGACAKQPRVEKASDKTVTFTHTLALTTCIGCHEHDRPRGPVGRMKFDHNAVGAFGECISCHGAKDKAPGDSWAIPI